MSDLKLFKVTKTTPSSANNIQFININPVELDIGEHKFEGKSYMAKFKVDLLDRNEDVVGQGLAYCNDSISEKLHDIIKDKDLSWELVLTEVVAKDKNQSLNLQKVELSLTYEQQKTLRKYIKPLDEMGDFFEKGKEAAHDKKEKAKDALASLNENLCKCTDKVKDKACNLMDKAKNADVSKKQAALIGAGAAVVVLSLLHKCFSKK